MNLFKFAVTTYMKLYELPAKYVSYNLKQQNDIILKSVVIASVTIYAYKANNISSKHIIWIRNKKDIEIFETAPDIFEKVTNMNKHTQWYVYKDYLIMTYIQGNYKFYELYNGSFQTITISLSNINFPNLFNQFREYSVPDKLVELIESHLMLDKINFSNISTLADEFNII